MCVCVCVCVCVLIIATLSQLIRTMVTLVSYFNCENDPSC